MNARRLAGSFLIAAVALMGHALCTTEANAVPANTAAPAAGLHDFDFLVGRWKVHHRQRKMPLSGRDEWTEFEGTLACQTYMDGAANVDDNVLDKPSQPFRAVTLRSFDPKAGVWSIWWLDSRAPQAALDPPVRGHFEQGVGRFYSDDSFNGKPVRVRFEWSAITHSTAHWEQAYSTDGGKSWEVNWVMDFTRTR